MSRFPLLSIKPETSEVRPMILGRHTPITARVLWLVANQVGVLYELTPGTVEAQHLAVGQVLAHTLDGDQELQEFPSIYRDGLYDVQRTADSILDKLEYPGQPSPNSHTEQRNEVLAQRMTTFRRWVEVATAYRWEAQMLTSDIRTIAVKATEGQRSDYGQFTPWVNNLMARPFYGWSRSLSMAMARNDHAHVITICEMVKIREQLETVRGPFNLMRDRWRRVHKPEAMPLHEFMGAEALDRHRITLQDCAAGLTICGRQLRGQDIGSRVAAAQKHLVQSTELLSTPGAMKKSLTNTLKAFDRLAAA